MPLSNYLVAWWCFRCVCFLIVYTQPVGWDSWYWLIIAGFIGLLIVFMHTVPVLVIALIIVVIWSGTDKGVDFLQDKGVLEKTIEDKVEEEVENKREKMFEKIL